MQPGKKKKKSWVSWRFAYMEYYFAHVERFSDCLKRPEHGNSLRGSVAGPEQTGQKEYLGTPINHSHLCLSNKHVISTYYVQVLGWVLSIQVQITPISQPGGQAKEIK